MICVNKFSVKNDYNEHCIATSLILAENLLLRKEAQIIAQYLINTALFSVRLTPQHEMLGGFKTCASSRHWAELANQIRVLSFSGHFCVLNVSDYQ